MLTSKFVITTAPKLQKSALRELKHVSHNLKKICNFKDGIFLAETDMPTSDFTESLVKADPIFVKHIMPVQAEVALTGWKAADLPAILENTEEICKIATDEEFSVQCRRIGTNYEYSAKDVEVFVGSSFAAKGAIPIFSDTKVEVKDLRKIISIFLFFGSGYVGCSTARENLNEHCDEYRIFSKYPREVSRAEFKLKEAIRKFGLNIPWGRALDLGAAPGGWTKVLADAGMQVIAVDPAQLDKKVLRIPTVTYVKSKAEDYTIEGDFELLVNDMNVDPEESAKIMVNIAPHLKPDSFAVMTCKLVIRNADKLLSNIKPILESAYEILRIKHLFHNRREVTILLRRKSDDVS